MTLYTVFWEVFEVHVYEVPRIQELVPRNISLSFLVSVYSTLSILTSKQTFPTIETYL